MTTLVRSQAPHYRVSYRSNFFANQCTLLEEHLSLAKELLDKETVLAGDSSSQAANLNWPQHAVSTELRRVLTVGRTPLDGCEREHCRKAYMRKGERTQAFAEALREIVWCTSMVYYYNRKMCSPGVYSSLSLRGHLANIYTDDFPQAIVGAKELYLLQKAALADQEELQNLLDIWIGCHDCSARKCGRHSQSQADEHLCLAHLIQNISRVRPAFNAWITVREALVHVRQIGKGSYGTVFETKWMGDTYAKNQFDGPGVLENFKAEVDALANLIHPHIMKVLACNVACRPYFFLMEIMPHDLRTYMDERMCQPEMNPPFSISASIDLMLQLSEATSYMNSKGMVHRDLKAANILVKAVDDPVLCKEGFVIAKLADFGLGKSKREVSVYAHQTRNVGTTLWMALEIFSANEMDDVMS